MVSDINVTFLGHILPQMVSLIILSFVFIQMYRTYSTCKYNHHQIGNLAAALMFLVVGKLALFVYSADPTLVKFYIDISLGFYFLLMVVTMSRFMRGNKKYQIWMQILLLPMVVEFILPGNFGGEFICMADLYLIVIVLLGKIPRKVFLVTSFAILGVINLLADLDVSVITYSQYAWLEVFGQFFFALGLFQLCRDYMEGCAGLENI